MVSEAIRGNAIGFADFIIIFHLFFMSSGAEKRNQWSGNTLLRVCERKENNRHFENKRWVNPWTACSTQQRYGQWSAGRMNWKKDSEYIRSHSTAFINLICMYVFVWIYIGLNEENNYRIYTRCGLSCSFIRSHSVGSTFLFWCSV